MTPEQEALIDALKAHLERDPGVEALWLAGSLGAGGGDAWSDVDLLALAADGQAMAVSERQAAAVEAAFDAVLVNRLFGGRVLNVVTADWRRFDITLVERSELGRYDAGALTALFNTGAAQPPRRGQQPYRPSAQTVEALAKEFLRVHGMLPVAIGREEYEIGLAGAELLRRMLFDLMLEENAVAPARRGGAMRRNPLLTAEQRAAFRSLPAMAGTRASVIEGSIAIARLFLPRAHRLAARIGAAWPDRLEAATRRHLKATLGVEL
jgi:hypothetical protein